MGMWEEQPQRVILDRLEDEGEPAAAGHAVRLADGPGCTPVAVAPLLPRRHDVQITGRCFTSSHKGAPDSLRCGRCDGLPSAHVAGDPGHLWTRRMSYQQPAPFRPCEDCLTPITCEESGEERCP